MFPGVKLIYGSTQECAFITPPMDRPALTERTALLDSRAAWRVLA